LAKSKVQTAQELSAASKRRIAHQPVAPACSSTEKFSSLLKLQQRKPNLVGQMQKRYTACSKILNKSSSCTSSSGSTVTEGKGITYDSSRNAGKQRVAHTPYKDTNYNKSASKVVKAFKICWD